MRRPGHWPDVRCRAEPIGVAPGGLHQLGSIALPPSWCNTPISGVTPVRNKADRGDVQWVGVGDIRALVSRLRAEA